MTSSQMPYTMRQSVRLSSVQSPGFVTWSLLLCKSEGDSKLPALCEWKGNSVLGALGNGVGHQRPIVESCLYSLLVKTWMCGGPANFATPLCSAGEFFWEGKCGEAWPTALLTSWKCKVLSACRVQEELMSLNAFSDVLEHLGWELGRTLKYGE